MRWIAPPERDTDTNTLEQRLWDAADQLRANSGLTAQQYSQPVLGLIFLRFAEARFAKRRAELEAKGSSGRRGSRVEDAQAYHAEGVLYLPRESRYPHLLSLPEGTNVGKAVNEAMRLVERDNKELGDVLPKSYQLFSSVLLKSLLKKISEIPASIDYDAFGRIYEYFLGEFARTEGQKGGEIYTPSSIVRLLVEVLEPYHGKILDPACGSGGMFVQSARFVAEHRKNPAAELAIHGQESDAPGRARRVVRDGDIIWSCVRPNRRSYAPILEPDADTIASTGFAVLSARQVPFAYLYHATTTDEFVAYLTNHATGAAYPAVSAPTFEGANIVVPPKVLLKKFDAIAQPMLRLVDSLHRENANLRTTRDLLLPRLMSGQLTLAEAEAEAAI